MYSLCLEHCSGIEVVLWTLLNSGIILMYLSAQDIHS